MFQLDSWTFFIPFDEMINTGWSAFDIENLMDKYDIKRWGSQITSGEFFFSVELKQAKWTEYILLRNNIPIGENSMGPPLPKKKPPEIIPAFSQKMYSYNLFNLVKKLFNKSS